MDGRQKEDATANEKQSHVYYPADPKTILEDLFKLMHKDTASGHAYWELTEELDSLLHFNITTIQSQLQHEHCSESKRDLSRLVATSFVLHKILLCYNKMMDGSNDSGNNAGHGSFLEQSKIEGDKSADFFQFLVEASLTIPLENVQNLVAAAYFCIHMFTKYPEFLKTFSDENWRASFRFFSTIGDYLCRE